jgi:hypothetical protein
MLIEYDDNDLYCVTFDYEIGTITDDFSVNFAEMVSNLLFLVPGTHYTD